jgi:cobalt-zinc-cadmium efflux system membrane fusion protein
MPQGERGSVIRIATIDVHPMFREALKRILEEEQGFEVIAEGSTERDALRIAQRMRPDVLLLDMSPPKVNGIDLLAQLAAPLPRVILLTAMISEEDVVHAVQSGARGILLKTSSSRLLIDSVRAVANDRHVIDPALMDGYMRALTQRAAPRRPYGLTERELQVVAGVAAGARNRDIAQRMCVSIQTIKHHLTRIFDKTGTSGRLGLMLLAVQERLAVTRCGRNVPVGRSGGTTSSDNDRNPLNVFGVSRPAPGSMFVKRGSMRASVFLFVCLLGALVSAACTAPAAAAKPTRDKEEPQQDGVVHIREASRSYITTETVSGAKSGESIIAPARVDFRDGAVSQLGAPLDGRIVKVHVQIGDRIREGDPLITLDCPDAAEMRAAVESATASLREARSALDRQNRMMQQGVGTERDRIAAETRVSELEAELARVQADVAFIGMGTGTGVVVRAPINGIVISRRATVGMTVQKASDPVVEIGDPSAIWIVADVFERDLALVREAARAHVELSSLSGALDGHVTSIGSVVATGLRTAPVRIAVEHAPMALRPGMFGRVQIDGTATNLTLPTDAILIRDGKESFVYVEQGPLTFVRRPVVVAQHAEGGRVRVVSGIAPGDKVVVKGALLLDGSADQLL